MIILVEYMYFETLAKLSILLITKFYSENLDFHLFLFR